jgi:cob(I)alamin adenosyltransferase
MDDPTAPDNQQPRISTRAGDRGETGTLGGPRVAKDAARIEALGGLDELNSLVGLARAEALPEAVDRLLERVQHELFALGAEVAASALSAPACGAMTAGHVEALEREIERFDAPLLPLRRFILPGGTRGAATLQVARAVCRRAERRLVALAGSGKDCLSPHLVAYLNRLGDLLFVLARSVNADADIAEASWEAGRQ